MLVSVVQTGKKGFLSNLAEATPEKQPKKLELLFQYSIKSNFD